MKRMMAIIALALLSLAGCGRDGAWSADELEPAGEMTPAQGAALEITEIAEGVVTYSFVNNGDTTWLCSPCGVTLQVELGGSWYIVPQGRAEPDGVLRGIRAGDSREYEYELPDRLPHGSYRLAVENAEARFEVDGDTYADVPGNELWDEVTQRPYDMFLTRFDGESGSIVELCEVGDGERRERFADALSSVDAIPAGDWTADMIELPIYGVELHSEGNREGVVAAWSNGYLILSDRSVYKFGLDLGELWEDAARSGGTDFLRLADMPCARWLALCGGVWDADLLEPAGAVPEGQADVEMELVSVGGGTVTYSFTNHGGRQWEYGPGDLMNLQVNVDGKWYVVPDEPHAQTVLGARTVSSIAYYADPGGTRVHSHTVPGYFPSGTYRLVTLGLTVEFEYGGSN